MKYWIAVLAATALFGQQAAHHDLAGDDIRGYSDTPQLPNQKWKVHDMERPRPEKVTPGPIRQEKPPSDAIVLFDGKDLSKWVQRAAAAAPPRSRSGKWRTATSKSSPGPAASPPRKSSAIASYTSNGRCPRTPPATARAIGNSGVELMGRYEVQVLESNSHLTYADGQAGAIYGVWPPLVNPARPQGEWNVYDIFFEAPRFNGGKLVSPPTLPWYSTASWSRITRTIWAPPSGARWASTPPSRRAAAHPPGPQPARPLPQHLDPKAQRAAPVSVTPGADRTRFAVRPGHNPPSSGDMLEPDAAGSRPVKD